MYKKKEQLDKQWGHSVFVVKSLKAEEKPWREHQDTP